VYFYYSNKYDFYIFSWYLILLEICSFFWNFSLDFEYNKRVLKIVGTYYQMYEINDKKGFNFNSRKLKLKFLHNIYFKNVNID